MPHSFAHFDTSKPDGCYVTLERRIEPDETADLDYDLDQARLDAWHRGKWQFVGVRAVAHVNVIANGVGTVLTIESAGIWGIESDSDESFLDETYRDEVAALKDLIAALANPQYTE